ncbi:putative orphan protein [Pseudoalteromonas translucida]|uniref:Orphan protein n=1 Tax=Pseudoalteromonas translucida (strain TAC 125) TaxID=326442 RepID=Q3IBX7_PSET1|nr:putative orphan protein [Pseudoalteromonas translucida]
MRGYLIDPFAMVCRKKAYVK